MVNKRVLTFADGRQLVTYDTGAPDLPTTLTLLWHHGSPQTGVLLEPLLAIAAARDIRLVSYARPSYGGSTPNPDRDVASAASDVSLVVDALGIDRFVEMGASGGGPHALACAAQMPERVIAAVTFASPAPYDDGYDWFGGMASPGGLQAARKGRAARARYAETAEFDPSSFVAADWTTLDGPWGSLGRDAVEAGAAGPDGLIDDDVALASPWGFDVAAVEIPVLLIQGGLDRVIPPSHADWLVRNCPSADLWLRPRDGHIAVLNACSVAADWLLAMAGLR